MGRVRETLHDVLRQTDAVLLALCVASTLYGMVLIASATSFRGTLKYVAVQGLGLLIGLVLYFFLSSIDVFALAKQWKWLLGFNVGFLLLLLTPFGQSSGGNRAWLGVNSIGKKLGVDFLRHFPITVQPAEVVKVFFIVLLAYQLALLKDRRDLVRFENVIQPTAHTAFMVGLIVVISGDAGSALVYLFIFICMVFCRGHGEALAGAGARRRCGGVSCRVASGPAAELYARPFPAVLDHSYQPDDAGFQQTRGLMALGSGELTGQGLFHGAQTQSSNVWSIPERQTDFIFSVCGEELGFLGCALIIVLLLAIVVRCLLVARDAATPMESYVCVGMAGMLIFQTIANIGMCLFLMPVIGLTLPFFSYGGSSIVTLFAAMGIVSGVKKRSRPEWLTN
ncbi:MAG: FtsW/RodA/SpoVE family cell cycle protein [Clostridia bacterium]